MGNFVTATPNEAVLVSGVAGTRLKVGSTGWRWWILDRVERLSLELVQLELKSVAAETVQGVKIDVTAVANVKVKARFEPKLNDEGEEDPTVIPKLNKRKILQAAQQFGGKSVADIHNLLKQALEGHQRQILGTLTVEQIFKDRASFSTKVREHVTEDLDRMGFEVVSYSIKEISDDNGYMDSLGATQTASVMREAQEGKAKNESEARQKVATAEANATIAAAKATREAHVAANTEKEIQVESDEKLALAKAEVDKRVGEAREVAEAAVRIMQAQQEQEVIKEQTQQKYIQREVETEIAQQEAKRQWVEAEGLAKARLVAQEQDAKAVLVRAEAEAERVRRLAKAEADAIRYKGEAEAATIRLQAEAYNQFGQAALAHKLIEQLPAIAAEISKPLAQTDKITFISGGGEGGGPSALTKDVTSMLGQLPSAVSALTGFDLRQAIQNTPDYQDPSSAHQPTGRSKSKSAPPPTQREVSIRNEEEEVI